MFNAEIIVFILYFVILFFVAMGFFFNGGNKNEKDYFLGGRRMGPWVPCPRRLLICPHGF